MKTKWFILCLFTLLVNITANAISINGICYTLNSTDKTATVTYYSTTSSSNSNYYSGDIQIPSSVTYSSKSYRVIAIGASAFKGCVNITSINIPNSVTSIGEDAFSGCSGMTDITIPTSVTSIGSYAFIYCSGLSTISLPSSVTSLGNYLFADCTGLTSVTMTSRVSSISKGMFSNCSNLRNFYIPTSVTTIQEFAFENCSNLTSITLPPSIVEIQNYAFYGCIYLSTINIPANVRTIGSYPISYTPSGDYYYEHWDESYYNYKSPFSGCSSLKSFVVDEDNPYYSSIDGVLYNKAGDILYDFPKGKSGIYTVPSQTKAMNYGILSGCDKLTGLYLSDSLWVPNTYQFPFGGRQIKTLHIGKNLSGEFQTANAAAQLPNLETITVDEANTTWWVEDGVLYGVSYERVYYWGDNLQPIYSSLILYPKKKTNSSFSVPEGVKSIAPRAMGANSYLKTISLPSTLRSIGDYAFMNCSNLQTVNNLPSRIESYAFSGCSKLSSINLSPRVTRLGESAFENCTSLKNIVLGKALEYEEVWDGIFYGCNSIEHIYVLSNNLTSYGYDDIDEDYVHWIVTHMFDNYNAIVHVPSAYLSSYRSSGQWSQFNIVGFVMNDVNGDGERDVVDVVDIARYVVGTPAETFLEILADINSDGDVNVGDAVSLVNLIAGDQNFAKPMMAPRKAETSDDALSLIEGGNGLSLALQNNRDYTAFQFDLYVPEGTDVTQMLLNVQRKQKHQLLYKKVNEGHWRVAALSTSNRSFEGNDGELLSITLDGISNEGVTLSNILFFDTEGNGYQFDDITLNGTTAIEIPLPTLPRGEGAVYTLDGRRISESSVLPKGIYIVNGKKVVVK